MGLIWARSLRNYEGGNKFERARVCVARKVSDNHPVLIQSSTPTLNPRINDRINSGYYPEESIWRFHAPNGKFYKLVILDSSHNSPGPKRYACSSISKNKSQLLREFEEAFKSELEQRRRQLCFINEIPTDVMVRILGEVMELHHPEVWSFKYLNELCRVQRSWKDIIYSASNFWPTLRAADPPWLHHRILTETNTNGPLMVIYSWIKDNRNKRRDFFDSISSACARWRGLHWEGPQGSWRTFQKELLQPTPQLEELCLNLKIEWSEALMFVHLDQLLEGCHFRRLSLHHVTIPWDSPRFSGLESVNICGPWKSLPKLPRILEMMSSSPSLGKLILGAKGIALEHHDIVYPEALLPGVIDLPFLKVMIVQMGDSTNTYLLAHIRAINCRSLVSGCLAVETLSDLSGAFSQTLAPILNRLDEFKLYYNVPPLMTVGLITAKEMDDGPIQGWDRRDGAKFTVEPRPTLRGTIPEDLTTRWLPLAKFLASACKTGTNITLSVRGPDGRTLFPDLVGFCKAFPSSLNLLWDNENTEERMNQYISRAQILP
jgi:hypothetical protein